MVHVQSSLFAALGGSGLFRPFVIRLFPEPERVQGTVGLMVYENRFKVDALVDQVKVQRYRINPATKR
jgi:hypothetical protein